MFDFSYCEASAIETVLHVFVMGCALFVGCTFLGAGVDWLIKKLR